MSDTAGDLSTTAGTKTVSLALALPGSTTQILFWPNFDVVLTKDQQNALASLGTPSASNLYEDQYDTSNGSTKTATTIGFVSGTKSITDSGNGLVTAGFKQGTQITIT